MTKLKIPPQLLLAAATLFWAGNWIVGRAIRHDVPPIALSFWRWVVAGLCMLPLVWPKRREIFPALAAHWKILIPFGLLGIGFYNALAYIGLTYTEVTNGAVLNSFTPIVIVINARLFFGRRLRRAEAVGITISSLGVLAIVARGDPAILAGLSVNIGDLWILASVLSWGLYTNLLSRRPAGVDALVMLAAMIMIGIVAMVPFYLWEMSTGKFIHPTPVSFLALAYVGTFPAFLGYLCWNRGVAELGPAKSGLYMHLVPVFALLLSTLLLGEVPQSYHFFGIACIIGGIYLVSRH
ncbi:MAG: DMT family transporter [Rhodocyclaceae bacterium]|nr:DMT family transporter [Rhodocyclaceae bacterium]MBX3667798.1 DMT family transporter [Rhodocyclaceae bacterium]